MFDVLLRGGWVIDGLGNPRVRADVGVYQERIAAVGDLSGAEARYVLDCAGLCVSPGWVDIHGHADWTVLDYPVGLNLLRQGCTLTVAGNCGMSPAPVTGRTSEMMRWGPLHCYDDRAHQAMAERRPSLDWSMGDWLDEVERSRPGLNYAQLVGHTELRRAVMGHEAREAEPPEVQQMERLLQQSLEEGAFGLSSGLVYIPACWSTTSELLALARIAAYYDAVYTSHIRGERETNIEATREFIEIAELSGVRAHMSHMQSKYPIYGNAVLKIDLLEAARARGADLSADSEAFPNCAATPAGFLQIYHLSPEERVARLSDPQGRADVVRTMRTIDPWHPQGRFGPGGVPYRRAWDRVVIYDCPHDRTLEGQSVAQVAAERGVSFEDALFDLAVAEGGRGPLMIHDYIEDEHYRLASWPHCIYPSVDQGLFDPAQELTELDLRYWRDTGYPGTIGLFPRVLGQFVREEKLMTLEDAVRRMTSFAVQRIGIADRGAVLPGVWADLTVFDPQTIALRGKDADPRRIETFYPVGLCYVLVNGHLVMDGQRYTGERVGHVLRQSH